MNHRTHSGSTVVSNANSNASTSYRGQTHSTKSTHRQQQHQQSPSKNVVTSMRKIATKPTDFDAIQSIPFDENDLERIAKHTNDWHNDETDPSISAVFRKLSSYFSNVPKALNMVDGKNHSANNDVFENVTVAVSKRNNGKTSGGNNNHTVNKHIISNCENDKRDTIALTESSSVMATKKSMKTNANSFNNKNMKMCTDKRDVDKCDEIYSKNLNCSSDSLMTKNNDKIDYKSDDQMPTTTTTNSISSMATRLPKRAQKIDGLSSIVATTTASSTTPVASDQSFTLPRVTLRQK